MKQTRKDHTLRTTLTVVLFVLLCTACKGNIGLGGTIDIDRPTITVDSPSMKAVVRNSFRLKGKISDDVAVSSVVVSISGPGLTKPLIETAAVDNKAGSWSLVLNKPKNGTFPLKDGKYTFQIMALDATGKKSEVETVFDIDNTPPLLVLHRPSTIDGSGQWDVFGDVFSIEGQVADSTDVYTLSFAAQGNGRQAQKNINNVPPTIRMKVSSFSDNSSPFYTELYEYNHNQPVFTEQHFSYGLEIADMAAEYDSPDSDLQPQKGNRTPVYYLYDELYDILKYHSVEDIYAYLNGSKPFTPPPPSRNNTCRNTSNLTRTP